MAGRIETLCSHITYAEVFADVGCDHGYCTRYVLERGLCGRAYISDISGESLKKAAALLEKYIADGACVPVCADGLKGIGEPCTLAMIAGMGGEEIVRILSESEFPARFILQPMKNSEKLRAFLLRNGCRITADYTFEDGGKFYDLIAGEREGGDVYSDWELAFGRDNLKNPSAAFLKKVREEQRKIRTFLADTGMSRESRGELLKRLWNLEEISDAVDGDL